MSKILLSIHPSRTFVFFLLSFFNITFFSQFSWPHARLVSPPPRSNNDGLKSPPPCGGIVAKTPTVLNMGSEIQVKWTETINHPGQFDFSLLTDNDTIKTPLTSYVKKVSENNTNVPHAYLATIKLPEGVQCENCTLQMIQVMSENPKMPSYYYSCADIKIMDPNITPPTSPPSNPPPTDSPPSTEAPVSSQKVPGLIDQDTRPTKFSSHCGSIATLNTNERFLSGPRNRPLLEELTVVLLLLLPLGVWMILRRLVLHGPLQRDI